MSFKILLISGVFIGVFSLTSSAALQAENSKSETQLAPASGFNWSYYNIAALGTAILVVGAGLAALMSLFLPVMTFKLCLMLGGCQDTLDSYVDRFIAEGDQGRQKRSMEYIEPILTTLVSAYEKYADADVKKKSKRLSF